jgi:hypothetical protein
LFYLSTGNQFVEFFGRQPYELIDREFIRPFYSSSISYLCFIGSLYYLSISERIFKVNYLIIVNVLSTLIIALSATRGYFLAFAFVYLLFIIFIRSRKPLIGALKATPIFILATFMFNFLPNLDKYVSFSFERLLTIKYLFQGDLSVGGTDSRLSIRAEPLLKYIYEQPYFGYGFSDIFHDHYDGHIGNVSVLLNGGIIGLLIIIIFLIYIAIKMYNLKIRISKNNLYANSLIVLIFGIIGLIIIHSTSGIVFSYLFDWRYGTTFMLFLFYAFINTTYNEAKTVEKRRR